MANDTNVDVNVDLAILAMYAYNIGNFTHIFKPLIANDIGAYTFVSAVSSTDGFTAGTFKRGLETVISYRGTDLTVQNFADAKNGWAIAFGLGLANPTAARPQVADAVQYYRDVVAASDGDVFSNNITLIGHSLGGAFAGFVSSFFGRPTVLFDNADFEVAAARDYAAVVSGSDEIRTGIMMSWLGWLPCGSGLKGCPAACPTSML